MEKIYILGKKPETINELLRTLYSYVTNDNSIFKAIETYSDEECLTPQCSTCKNRSFDDLMCIVNTYFPDTNEATLITELMNLMITGDNNKYFCWIMFCSDIHKPVINYWLEESFARFVRTSDLKLSNEYGDSNYSAAEILSLINIKDYEEMFNTIKQKHEQEIQIETGVPGLS